MKARTAWRAILLVTGVAWGATSHASAVLGLSVNDSSYADYSDVEIGFGGKAYFGYHFETMPFLVELGYLDLGDHEIQNFPADLSFVGGQAVLGVMPYRTKSRRLTTWLKGGYYSGNAELRFSGGGSTIRDRTEGGSFEIGVGWMFKPWLGVRAEIGTLFDVEDFAAGSDVVMLNIGLVTAFPGYTASVRSSKGNAPPPVTQTIAATLPPPPEAAAPMPVVPPPPSAPKFLAGETAMAMPGAMLRSRPAGDGQSILALNSGAPVVLRSDVKNVTGTWWYVEAAGQRGWLNETDLQPKMP
jgi:hypothetical protein